MSILSVRVRTLEPVASNHTAMNPSTEWLRSVRSRQTSSQENRQHIIMGGGGEVKASSPRRVGSGANMTQTPKRVKWR